MSRSLSVAEVTEATGLSSKALRVYERHGLIEPGRTAAGWRIYDNAAIARLHKIKVLKLMGLSLAEVRTVLDEGVDLARLLQAHEVVLTSRQNDTAKALSAIRAAVSQLLIGKRLSTDDLIHLFMETNAMDTQPWSKAEQQLADKHYSASQLARIIAHKQSPAFADEVTGTWDQLIRDIDAAKHLSPGSDEADALAQRWTAASLTFHEGDEALMLATENWYRDGYADPETSAAMPFPKDVWTFIDKALDIQRRKSAK